MVKGLTPQERAYPSVIFDVKDGRLWIGAAEIPLSHAELGFFLMLAKRFKAKKPIRGWPDLEEDILELKASCESLPYGSWIRDFTERKYETKEDPRKLASSIRKKLLKTISDKQVVDLLIPSPKSGSRELYPAAKIRFKT